LPIVLKGKEQDDFFLRHTLSAAKLEEQSEQLAKGGGGKIVVRERILAAVQAKRERKRERVHYCFTDREGNG